MADELRGLARRALDGVERRLERSGSARAARSLAALRIARHDPRAARAYAARVSELEERYDRQAAQWFGELVHEVARGHPELASELADVVAIALIEDPVEDLRRYQVLLQRVLVERPEATSVVAEAAPKLLRSLRPEALWDFVQQGLRLHELSAERAISFLRRESWQGVRQARALRSGVSLSEIARVLRLYARAHCGRDVEIVGVVGRVGGSTDGYRIQLPTLVDRYGDERDFLVYRVATALNTGHIEFGTFELRLSQDWPAARPGETEIERLCRRFEHPELANTLFVLLEQRRVEGHVRATYPGVARDLNLLRDEPRAPAVALQSLPPHEQLIAALRCHARGQPPPSGLISAARALLPELCARLDVVCHPAATVQDVAVALEGFYTSVAALRPHDAVETAVEGLPDSSAIDFEQLQPQDRAVEEAARQLVEEHETMQQAREWVQAQAAPPEQPEDVERWLEELAKGEGSALPAPAEHHRQEQALDAGPDPTYPEWDSEIDDYRPSWVRVREERLPPEQTGFVDRVRDERGALIRQLRRSFEALRPSASRRLRGQNDGDELDIDAAIEARITARAGGSPSDRIYIRRRRIVRDVAVAFLIDLSSSTNEVTAGGRRIFDVEKEALVCIAEAVDAIGDRSAIFGFSGYGRENVEVHVAKDFSDPLNESVRQRIGALRWKMENRDGAALRHVTQRLLSTGARIKLLILLSDGRPLDCGCPRYFGPYAQADTRVALVEARQLGVHPFCITVDPAGADYLATMYGQHGYAIVDRVEALPARLPAIYRRLTR